MKKSLISNSKVLIMRLDYGVDQIILTKKRN